VSACAQYRVRACVRACVRIRLVRLKVSRCRSLTVLRRLRVDRALTPDLTPDYDERTSLTMYRQFQALVSGVVFTFAHSIIIDVESPASSFSTPICGLT
jgi:hypothetical protein